MRTTQHSSLRRLVHHSIVRWVHRPSLPAAIVLTLAVNPASAQWSGFGSVSTGYQSNPLYNSLHHGDQITTTFMEIAYSRQDLSARYMGGLTLFNQLSERNYLEHSLSTSLVLKRGRHLGQPRTLEPIEGSKEEGDAGEDGSAPDDDPGPPDSVGVFGSLGARLTARHDKQVFRDYNNLSAALLGSYFRGYRSPWHLRLAGEAGYRSYPTLDELSNATAVLTAGLGAGRNAGTSFGGWITGSFRYYTTATYDTTLFVSKPGSQNGKKTGSGKSGAAVGSSSSSSNFKQVLSNAEVQTVFQITAGLYLAQAWEGGSLRLSGLYRITPSGAARILARTSETATINEDLYNDHFSSEGPELAVSVSQSLPLDLRAVFGCRVDARTFSAPAFDLEGIQTATSRADRHYGLDLYVSRYMALSDSFGMDLAVSGFFVRNASNDAYNDFHGWGLAFSVGAGF